MAEVTYIGVDPDGFETRVTISGSDFDEDFTQKLSEIKAILGVMGITPKTVAAPVAAATVTQAPKAVNPDMACQFCGREVQGTSFAGRTFTAEQIVRSRTEKMARLGRTPGPVCGQCWTRAGHAKAWEEFYKANG